jgi:hypothetical protein
MKEADIEVILERAKEEYPGGEDTLTENAASPFQAEPAWKHKDTASLE